MRTILRPLLLVLGLFLACCSKPPKVEAVAPLPHDLPMFCLNARTELGVVIVVCCSRLSTCEWIERSVFSYGDQVGIAANTHCYERPPDGL